MALGKMYTREEARDLCKAYLKASEDPIVGRDQKHADFRAKVFSEFSKLCPPKMSPEMVIVATMLSV